MEQEWQCDALCSAATHRFGPPWNKSGNVMLCALQLPTHIRTHTLNVSALHFNAALLCCSCSANRNLLYSYAFARAHTHSMQCCPAFLQPRRRPQPVSNQHEYESSTVVL
eukprot:376764-Pelagomonas_calceolata.AAC.2